MMWLLTGHFLMQATVLSNELTFTVKFERETKLNDNGTVKIVYSISPTTVILEVTDERLQTPERLKSYLEKIYSTKVAAIEKTRAYDDDLKPSDELKEEDVSSFLTYLHAANKMNNNQENKPPAVNLICSNYYGMGIEKVWNDGYTGKDIRIAVTDVGINTDLLDLSASIDKNLSYNYFTNSRDITPEYFPGFQDRAQYFTDHGNRMASVIAAVKENNVCSAGIAYKSKVVGLKIYQVKKSNYNAGLFELQPRHYTDSVTIVKALTYKPDQISIFANAWGPVLPFDTLDMGTREAFRTGASQGRRGLGTIYVVPSGPPGNGLANNVFTITVNAVGPNGTIPDSIFPDASVITSALAFGNNISSSSIVTTSLENRCISTFRGVSLATAQVAGITALALEANGRLSLRDIQHLMVRSSVHTGLRRETMSFQTNAAGWKFHPYYGFGLISAAIAVELAKEWVPVPNMTSVNMNPVLSSPDNRHFIFCHGCSTPTSDNCVTTVEHVEISLSLKTTSPEILMQIRSPTGTKSVVLDHSANPEPIHFHETHFTSVHFWDEMAFGEWEVDISLNPRTGGLAVTGLTMTLYGTHHPDSLGPRYHNSCERFYPAAEDINSTQGSNRGSEKQTDTNASEKYLYLALGLVLGMAAVGLCVAVFFAYRYNRLGCLQRFFIEVVKRFHFVRDILRSTNLIKSTYDAVDNTGYDNFTPDVVLIERLNDQE